MATALAKSEPVAAEVIRQADEVLGFSLSGMMAEGPHEDLTATKNAQPALLTHSVAVLRTIESRVGPVGFSAGHSLGEFSAYVAAATISFEDALTSVRLRGELMFETGRERPGTMAAVLGLGDEEIEDVCGRVDRGVCVPANYNSKGQVVISGDVTGVEQGMELAKDAGAKRVVRLNVSGGFHSPLMQSAAEGLRTKLDSIDFNDPLFPVASNSTAELVTSGPAARELLVEQLTSAVRWSASIGAMVGAGADRFLELGPGSVLCGLNRRSAKGLPCSAVGEPDDLASLEM
jgi:[acyl-carrier-protein] S-malonyltransferase